MTYDDPQEARRAQVRGERDVRITPEAARRWQVRGNGPRPMTEAEAVLWRTGDRRTRLRVKRATHYQREVIA